MYRSVEERELGLQPSPYKHVRRTSASVDLVSRLVKARELEGHGGCVNTVSFDPTGELLVSGSDDRVIVFWSWQSGKAVLRYQSGHRGNVFQARILPGSDGRTIISCAADGQVRLGTWAQGAARPETQKLAAHAGRTHKLALEPGSHHVFFSAGEDGAVRHYDLRAPPGAGVRRLLVCRSERAQGGGPLELNSIHCNPLAPWQFAVAGGDELVRVYDQRRLPSGASGPARSAANLAEPVRRLAPRHLRRGRRRVHLGPMHITDAKFSFCGEILASYNDEDIYLFAPESGPAMSERSGKASSVPESSAKRSRTDASAAGNSGGQGGPGGTSAGRHTGEPLEVWPPPPPPPPLPPRLAGAATELASSVADAREAAQAAGQDAPEPAVPQQRDGDAQAGEEGEEDGTPMRAAAPMRMHIFVQTPAGAGPGGGGVQPVVHLQVQVDPELQDAEVPLALVAQRAAAQARAGDAERAGEGEARGGAGREGELAHLGSDAADHPDLASEPEDSVAEEEQAESRPPPHPGEEEGEDDEVLQRYQGHRNARTVKGVSFMGASDEWVVSGSDCGHVYIWAKADAKLHQVVKGDADVVNCLEPHPHLPLTLATSGIEDTIKVWQPTAPEPKPLGPWVAELTAANKRAQGRSRNLLLTPHMLANLLQLQTHVPWGDGQRPERRRGPRGAARQPQGMDEESNGEEEGDADWRGPEPRECSIQ